MLCLHSESAGADQCTNSINLVGISNANSGDTLSVDLRRVLRGEQWQNRLCGPHGDLIAWSSLTCRPPGAPYVDSSSTTTAFATAFRSVALLAEFALAARSTANFILSTFHNISSTQILSRVWVAYIDLVSVLSTFTRLLLAATVAKASTVAFQFLRQLYSIYAIYFNYYAAYYAAQRTYLEMLLPDALSCGTPLEPRVLSLFPSRATERDAALANAICAMNALCDLEFRLTSSSMPSRSGFAFLPDIP